MSRDTSKIDSESTATFKWAVALGPSLLFNFCVPQMLRVEVAGDSRSGAFACGGVPVRGLYPQSTGFAANTGVRQGLADR